MPGVPEPVFGSDPLTIVVAAALSVVLASGFVGATRRLDWSRFNLFVGGVVVYWLIGGALWFGMEFVFGSMEGQLSLDPVGFAQLPFAILFFGVPVTAQTLM